MRCEQGEQGGAVLYSGASPAWYPADLGRNLCPTVPKLGDPRALGHTVRIIPPTSRELLRLKFIHAFSDISIKVEQDRQSTHLHWNMSFWKARNFVRFVHH